mmetsp:Transcript_24513/g.74264  ORF Transcript_24513/g.74264 Transcript_24513/m.74264 type:complete len:282 (+) Transcript_24513:332-1177(+)
MGELASITSNGTSLVGKWRSVSQKQPSSPSSKTAGGASSSSPSPSPSPSRRLEAATNESDSPTPSPPSPSIPTSDAWTKCEIGNFREWGGQTPMVGRPGVVDVLSLLDFSGLDNGVDEAGMFSKAILKNMVYQYYSDRGGWFAPLKPTANKDRTRMNEISSKLDDALSPSSDFEKLQYKTYRSNGHSIQFLACDHIMSGVRFSSTFCSSPPTLVPVPSLFTWSKPTAGEFCSQQIPGTVPTFVLQFTDPLRKLTQVPSEGMAGTEMSIEANTTLVRCEFAI